MTIQSLQWASADRDTLQVTLSAGRRISAPWPVNRTHWREKIQDWIDGGGAIAAEDPPAAAPSNGEIFDRQLQNQRVLKAVLLALADGSIVVGGKQSPADLKAAVVARM